MRSKKFHSQQNPTSLREKSTQSSNRRRRTHHRLSSLHSTPPIKSHSPSPSQRIPIPLPNPLRSLPILPVPIPPIEHDTLPPLLKLPMQIKRQIPRALVPRRVRALPRSFTSHDLSPDTDDNRRVGVGRISVRKRPPAGGDVQDVVGRVA